MNVNIFYCTQYAPNSESITSISVQVNHISGAQYMRVVSATSLDGGGCENLYPSGNPK